MSATNLRPFWGSHWPQPSSRFPNRNRKTFHCVHPLFSLFGKRLAGIWGRASSQVCLCGQIKLRNSKMVP